MTKEDIKKAAEKYQEMYPIEYGWTCYRFTIKDGNPVAYLKYTNPRYQIKYTIYKGGNYIFAEPLDGGNYKSYDLDDNPVDAILCLMLWMREKI